MSLFPISDGIEVEGTALAPGTVELTDGTNTLRIQASTTMITSYTMIMPPALGGIGQVLTMINSTDSGWSTIGSFSKIWTISDEKSPGVGGGPLTPSDTWVKRVLNTIVQTATADTSVQLAVAPAIANELLIQPGKYRIYTSIPAYNVRGHRCALYNESTASFIIHGTSMWTRNATTTSRVEGIFTVLVPSVFSIQTYCSNSPGNNNDGGRAVGVPGLNELYTKVIIEQI